MQTMAGKVIDWWYWSSVCTLVSFICISYFCWCWFILTKASTFCCWLFFLFNFYFMGYKKTLFLTVEVIYVLFRKFSEDRILKKHGKWSMIPSSGASVIFWLSNYGKFLSFSSKFFYMDEVILVTYFEINMPLYALSYFLKIFHKLHLW